MTDLPTYDEYRVEKLKVAAQSPVSDEIRLLDPRVSTWEGATIRALQVRLEGFVLAGCPKTVQWSASYPATWWDGFKQAAVANPSTRVGRWFKRRVHWELETERFKETYYARVCPHGVVAIPPHQDSLRVRIPKPMDHLQWLNDR
jgi:hypothetical protein